MNMQRFIANLAAARENARNLITSKNVMASDKYQDLLDATVNNMIEELNTIIPERIEFGEQIRKVPQYNIDKDALLKSILEDAEEFPTY